MLYVNVIVCCFRAHSVSYRIDRLLTVKVRENICNKAKKTLKVTFLKINFEKRVKYVFLNTAVSTVKPPLLSEVINYHNHTERSVVKLTTTTAIF